MDHLDKWPLSSTPPVRPSLQRTLSILSTELFTYATLPSRAHLNVFNTFWAPLVQQVRNPCVLPCTPFTHLVSYLAPPPIPSYLLLYTIRWWIPCDMSGGTPFTSPLLNMAPLSVVVCTPSVIYCAPPPSQPPVLWQIWLTFLQWPPMRPVSSQMTYLACTPFFIVMRLHCRIWQPTPLPPPAPGPPWGGAPLCHKCDQIVLCVELFRGNLQLPHIKG